MEQTNLLNEEDLYETNKEKFDELLKEGKNIREVEKMLEKPLPLPKINLEGNIPKTKKVIFYFKTEEEIALIKKYFRVLEYVDLNVNDSSLLIKLLKEKDKQEQKIKEENAEWLT